MITPWQMYWLTRLESVVPFGYFLIAGGFSGYLFMATVMQTSIPDFNRKWFLLPIAAIICGALIALFVPTTKEMAAIILIPKAVNAVASNERIQELPNTVLDLADAWLKELKPAVNKEGDRS